MRYCIRKYGELGNEIRPYTIGKDSEEDIGLIFSLAFRQQTPEERTNSTRYDARPMSFLFGEKSDGVWPALTELSGETSYKQVLWDDCTVLIFLLYPSSFLNPNFRPRRWLHHKFWSWVDFRLSPSENKQTQQVHVCMYFTTAKLMDYFFVPIISGLWSH